MTPIFQDQILGFNLFIDETETSHEREIYNILDFVGDLGGV